MAFKKVSTLVDVLEGAVGEFGPRKLFGTKRDGQYQWITYQEFGRLVGDFRGGLAALGIKAGDRVAIIANNRVEWAVAAYATYSLGGCFVPMYEQQHADDWKFIINDSGAKLLIVATRKIADQTRPMIGNVGALERVVCLEGEASTEDTYAHTLKLGQATPAAAVHPADTELAGFIYTSGTTGNPKGVLLTHKNFAHNVNAVREIFPLRADDCSLSFLPWAHSFGQTCELHCMFANGAAVGLAEDVSTIIANLAEVKPTVLFAVPRIFNRIYDGVQKKLEKEKPLKRKVFQMALANSAKRRELADKGDKSWWADTKHGFFDKKVFAPIRERFGGRLQYAFSGGAALSTEVAMFIDNLGITVYEGYGLSETSPVAAANCPGGRKIGSVGRPVPGCRIEIIPVEHIQEPGMGEIVIYGDNVMQGYHGHTDTNNEVFTADGGFRSGDLGRKDADGFVWITGRVKEQYKLENGKYVVPSPMEEDLKLSPYVNQIMIHGANRPYNVALIVPDFENLKEWARNHGKSEDPKTLVEDKDAHDLIQAQLAEYGKEFKGYEHPRKFRLLTEEFSTLNDMLTPKLSLKRRNVLKAYGHLIEEMYKD
jgi:long-chain acyl-CoA synthetase